MASAERISRGRRSPLRNLLITQSYHELAAAIAAVIGNGNANWSSFATWASKTAGQSIRGEEVPDEVGRVLRAEAGIEPLLAAFTKPFPLLGWLKMNFDVFDVENDPRGGEQSEAYRKADPREIVVEGDTAMMGPGGSPVGELEPDEVVRERRDGDTR